MRPIQTKKMHNSRSLNILPKQLEVHKSLNLVELLRSAVSNDSGDQLATERFNSIPFSLFVQGNVQSMKEETNQYAETNKTQRFKVRDPTNLGKLSQILGAEKTISIDEDDDLDWNLDFSMM